MRIKHGIVAWGLVAALGMASSAAAQSRVQVHGFMTQGYGSASDYPIFGITTDGTADYRTAALQARVGITSSDFIVVQASHQRLGASNFMQFEDDVELDWLFYQKRFLGNSIRVGKVPMPRGLFNETRDVGVLLPFFRASKAFYSEGVETVKGATLSRSFGFGDWTTDVTAFTGNYDIRVELTDNSGLYVTDSQLEKTAGGQVIVNSPVPGVRVGGSFMRSTYNDSDKSFHLWTLSADGSFDRFFVRGEYELASQDDFTYLAYYGQAGAKILGGLWANFQAEWNTNTVPIPGMGDFDIKAIKDFAYGASYRFSNRLVLKGEYHDFEGYQVGVPVSPFGPPVKNNYFIVGFSAAF